MKKLENGLVVFNATPHAITFATSDQNITETVEPDGVINAVPDEVVIETSSIGVEFVSTRFTPNEAGRAVIAAATAAGADVIVGSIIAAQAYPGYVVAMTPAPGFERVPPAEKRMNPYKFTVYGDMR